MKRCYLEVTFRRGKAFAAYLYLPRAKDVRSARVERFDDSLVVDFSEEGSPIGIEILDPAAVQLAPLNTLLAKLGAKPVEPADLAPLLAA